MELYAQDRGLEVRSKDGTRIGSFKASYALVIGESTYTAGWPKLAGVKTDVQLVSKALGDSGFQVTVKQDLSSDAVKQAYEDFIKSYGYDEGHRLLFYYAGHGHTLKAPDGRDMGYIVPVDAPNPKDDANGFKRKAINMNQFDAWAKQIEARHALFLFDSCFSGSIFNVTRALPDNINEKTVKAVRQFITSGSADEQVPDKSIFRDQFLAGIAGEADRGGDGYVTGAELGEFLDEKVVNYSKKTQHPQYGKIQDPALDKGDFVFTVPTGLKTAKGDFPSAPAKAPSFGAVIAATGNLSIQLTTAGTVSVAGLSAAVPAGVVPVNDLPAGPQTVTVRYADGKSESHAVMIPSGGTASLSFIYAPAPAPGPAIAVAAPVQRAPGNSIRGEIYVQGGTFQMGSTKGESYEKPVHEVRVTDFWMMKTEVTQKDYVALMGTNPSSFKGDNLPVEGVSWYDALAYANKLSQKDGLRPAYTINGTNVTCDFTTNGWRLPTEAEWEYAARGGQNSKGYTYAGSNDVNAVAWYTSTTKDSGTKPVGTKAANELGLHDLSGNVWEWCWDWAGSYSGGSQSDPRGASSGYSRVYRGGSWPHDASRMRSAGRRDDTPDSRSGDLGFRLLRPQVRGN